MAEKTIDPKGCGELRSSKGTIRLFQQCDDGFGSLVFCKGPYGGFFWVRATVLRVGVGPNTPEMARLAHNSAQGLIYKDMKFLRDRSGEFGKILRILFMLLGGIRESCGCY